MSPAVSKNSYYKYHIYKGDYNIVKIPQQVTNIRLYQISKKWLGFALHDVILPLAPSIARFSNLNADAHEKSFNNRNLLKKTYYC